MDRSTDLWTFGRGDNFHLQEYLGAHKETKGEQEGFTFRVWAPNAQAVDLTSYARKISDLQRRYDEQYGRIDEIEVQIDDVQSQIRNIRQEKISGDNIYRLLLAFDQVYEAASEVERKEFMRAFIERIELFPEKQLDGNWIRKIIFNFPVPVNGTEVKELPLENETMVETVVLMTRITK